MNPIRESCSQKDPQEFVVHFENNVSVFFPAAFLYEQRNAQSNTVFSEDEEGEHPQQSEVNRYRFVINIGRRDR